MRTRTYSYARANLAKLWNEIEDSQASLRIQRRGHQDMALIPADELESLQETAHLLRSPKNAARLLSALARSEKRTSPAIELAELRHQLGLDSED
jgi:antitoxin YefM